MPDIPKRSEITIDFSGEELIQIGQACVAMNCTFGEFIDKAIRNLVENSTKESGNGHLA